MSEVIPWPAGLKRTKPRLQIMAVLSEATTPLSAADIAKRTEATGTKSWFSTVYRVLQSFIEHDLVVQTSVSGSDADLYELKRDAHRHYAKCNVCQKIFPLPVCPIETMAASLPNFRVLGHRLELSGICAKCDKKLESSPR